MDYDLFNNHELVDGILSNNKPLIKYFFTEKCSGVRTLCQYGYFGFEKDPIKKY